ncbi:MAG: carboxyl transferase domain-containing protein [Myxococcales bacterium]|jgi:acetyl-CoA carboxylase carboxyltransferase component
MREIAAPMQGLVVRIDVGPGDVVKRGQTLLILEAMKMEHVIAADRAGIIRTIRARQGDQVSKGQPLVRIEEAETGEEAASFQAEHDLDEIRADLAALRERLALGLDENRTEAVDKRRKTNQRTARENVADLVDPETFVEYGALVIAAQRQRRSVQDLISRTPADGLIAGIGEVNGHLFPGQRARCVVMSYDYTVLAGTQGVMNHYKKDRLFELAEKLQLPVVLFAEGGGGRPGDTDSTQVAGLDCRAFQYFAELSGWVPLVGIGSGRCFAGNAALLGCCDVVIATRDSNIGMGGPAMIEGGGLGVFQPEQIGPSEIQSNNGVIDVLVGDETQAVAVAKRYLSYFQGPLETWSCADQRRLRSCVPENRLRVYDVREVIDTLADTDSVLELRPGFGRAMVTALARFEGRTVGIVANDSVHLGGAIDGDAADKASRFMQLCDAFDIPLLFLCDTPGFMVGPEAEATGLVRRAARMFVVGASLDVPFFTIVLRKGYGLGAQSMAGGSFKATSFTVAWPTGEFGGMGLEGAVKLGYRKELAAISDPAQREQAYQNMVAMAYDIGKATNVAAQFEIDAVIDPADSRHWILSALRSAPEPQRRRGKKRPCVNPW